MNPLFRFLRALSSRRTKRVILSGLSIAIVLGLWAFWWEPSSLRVVRHTIPIQHWHSEHSGLRVVILSDLHVGAPHRSLANLKEVVAVANAEKPDLILLLGDFVIQGVVGGRFVTPESIAVELAALTAPHGVVAVLGNHDWWYDGERVRRALESQGIRVLENQNVRLMHRGQAFWLCGLADLWTRGDRLMPTLATITDGEPVLVMMHNPDGFPDIPPAVSLSLAGHTHGGQVNLPFVGRPIVPSRFKQRYAYGLIEENGKKLFVTGGVGTSILPVRFRVSPEIVVLTLIKQ